MLFQVDALQTSSPGVNVLGGLDYVVRDAKLSLYELCHVHVTALGSALVADI